MNKLVHTSRYFYGKEIPQQSIDRGYVDYQTLRDVVKPIWISGDHMNLLVNENAENENDSYIYSDCHGNEYNQSERDEKVGELEERLEDLNDTLDETDDENPKYKEIEAEIYDIEMVLESLEEGDTKADMCSKYFLVTDSAAQIIIESTNDPVWYNTEYDAWIWGICFGNIAWEDCYTEVKIELED